MQENYLDTALASLPVQADVGGVLKYSGIVRTVLAKLKDQGVSPEDIAPGGGHANRPNPKPE